MRATIGAFFVVLIVGTAAAGPKEDDADDALGRGDYATVLRLIRPLAQRGHADAQVNLGHMYYLGQGVPQNYAEALRWYRLAAEQGLASAQFSIGSMYDGGYGVPRDHAAALKWYRLAAEQGHAFAQFNLGYIYSEGQGVPQDYVQAHMWFNLASAMGEPTAAEQRDKLAQRMTPAQVAKAQKLAREWKPTSAPAQR
jgi:uncharacterized protein